MREELECTRIPKRLRAAVESPKPWVSGLIHGPTGCGKSHLALQMCASVHGEFVNVQGFVALARQLATAEEESQVDYDFARLRRSEHLVLDDLGAEKLTDFAAETLYSLIDYRWGEEFPTIVTSNLSPSEIAEKHGDRLASRILGFGAPTKLSGPDLRLKP